MVKVSRRGFNGNEYLQELMTGPLRIAKWCALVPLTESDNKTSSKPRFVWSHLRFIYVLAVWMVMTLIFYSLTQTKINGSLINGKILDELIPPLLLVPLFLRISTKWESFVNHWDNIEKLLPRYGFNSSLRSKLNTILFFYLGFEIVYKVTSASIFVSRCIECLQLEHWTDYMRAYTLVQYHHVLHVIHFPFWLHGVLVVVDVMRSMQWLCSSLIVTCMATIFTARFKAYTDHIEATKAQLMPTKFWREMRDAYNNLSELALLLDSLLSPVIFATFIVDTVSIIINLFILIDSVKDKGFFLMMMFRCIRLIAVSLFTQLSVSAVYEESKKPLQALDMVPSQCYSKEVERLYEQVATETLALTGWQYFNVDRSVILTVISTIVTYEVVLIQFGSSPLEEGHTKGNYSTPHYCHDWIVPLYYNQQTKGLM